MEQENRRSLGYGAVAILVILVALIAGTVVYYGKDTIDKKIGIKQPIVQDSAALAIQHELVEQAENPSIVEYLQFREDIREQKRVENVFLSMPTVVIIDILRQHGTALSVEDIVRIYEDYPDIYNTVQSGARSQQYMDSINKNKPDKLPEKAPIDSILDSWNY